MLYAQRPAAGSTSGCCCSSNVHQRSSFRIPRSLQCSCRVATPDSFETHEAFTNRLSAVCSLVASCIPGRMGCRPWVQLQAPRRAQSFSCRRCLPQQALPLRPVASSAPGMHKRGSASARATHCLWWRATRLTWTSRLPMTVSKHKYTGCLLIGARHRRDCCAAAFGSRP